MSSYLDNYYKSIIQRNQSKLDIINIGSLDGNSPTIVDTFSNLKIELKEHQRTLLKACIELEETIHKPRCNSLIRYQSNIGIMGDNVGSGKSVTMLALIAMKPVLNNYVFPDEYSVYNNWGIITYGNDNIKSAKINSNVILVPHSIINQWETYIKTHTSLSYFKINSAKSSVFSKDKLETSNIILVSNNFFRTFIDQLNLLYNPIINLDEKPEKIRLVFDRFIIDEADNIKFGQDVYVNSLFTWFITSSIENLLFPSGNYIDKSDGKVGFKKVTVNGLHFKNFIRYLFERISYSSDGSSKIIKEICLKNSDDYVQRSFSLPLPNYLAYSCKTPNSIRLLFGGDGLNSIEKIREDLMEFINANDIVSLKEKLGFKVESTSSISDMITHNFRKTLNNEIKHRNYIESLSINDEDRVERLSKIDKKINDLEDSIKYVSDRINLDKNNRCPICYDDFTRPICNVNCCHQLFCMSCISSYFNSKTGKSGECPCCRNKIGFEGITIVDDEVSANNILSSNIKPKKEDLFIKLILDEKGGVQKKKWLVFSNYDATFQGLIERLEQCGVVFSKINGTVTHIDRVIKDFGDGKIQVLLLNAKQFGMGLNLQMATDILIYHQLDRELEKQVIGRAQRPGRIGALNVHYLCHDNELYYYNSHILNMKLVNLQDKILEI
jgi:hypothetical protein